MGGVRAVALLAFAGVVGLTLLVLGCALPMYQNWSPMFVLAFYVLSPVPLLIARRFQEDMTGTNACVELALFVTTGIVVSAFALPSVLAHAGTIKFSAALLVNTGSLVIRRQLEPVPLLIVFLLYCKVVGVARVPGEPGEFWCHRPLLSRV
ncbi:unnamed protein product [Caenorhabditis auriculariae]|uniref:Uncharacterized protein n=1 Tax=Caenorhabditis auriculariae TaxID=2777116 RepID=A0A8S1HU38_9PELO|nr:unnamed protein product [Caenorhabditis auriculariae]